MKLRLAAHGVELTTELKAFIERRIHFSLGRFSGKLRGLSMRLSDINGPRGGVDKTCDIRLDAGLPHAVVIRERQASIYAAIAYAMDRAERALRRNLSMETSGHRRMEKRA